MIRETLFTKKEEFAATRDGFGEGLFEAGATNDKVVALCADLTESTKMQEFKEAFPARFFEMGITEQNMSGVASGMAAMGLRPFMASYAMFSPGRNWEQIRTSIAYNNQGVVIVGAHAGLSVGPDGATHQALEDIALMQVMPNMSVYNPIDKVEAKAITLYLANEKKPAYLRLAREKSPIILRDDYVYTPGKMYILDAPKKVFPKNVGIICTGPITYEALKAKKILEKENVSVTVVHVACIKPLDEKFLLRFASTVSGIVTVEEHQMNGGLGSRVAQFLAWHYPMKVIPIAVMDDFGQSGKAAELYDVYGLSSLYIADAVRSIH